MAKYAIEVNVARKGDEPVWRDLVDYNDDPIWFDTLLDAEDALTEEARGDNARIMRYVGGIGRPLE